MPRHFLHDARLPAVGQKHRVTLDGKQNDTKIDHLNIKP